MFIAEITGEETDKLHKKVSENVRKIRLNKNLTQLDVSLALGLSNPSFVTNAESLNSSKKFNLNQLYKLSIIFDVELCEFFK